MDLNDIRAWYTVVMFVTFIGVVVWAYGKGRAKRFEQAAQLPFNEPEQPRSAQAPRDVTGDRP
jgi:cytochrome c oxidase cbb3-type subunit 4